MFNYFGSKARLAPTYQAPRHDLIIEPFAGAAGYSMYWLQRRSDLRAILIERHPIVAQLWQRLLAMEPEELWDYPTPSPGERSQDSMYLTATVATGRWEPLARGGSYKVTDLMVERFPGVRRRMAQTLSRVRGRVEIIHSDYRDAPEAEATWFIDPPYQREGGQYDSGNDIDFDSLGRWAQNRSGQLIVCESLGAVWLPFKPHHNNQSFSNGVDDSTEVVWYSHPEPDLLSLMEAAETQ